ncbi:hypothetical protein M3Y99_00534500 [Aphelenchoides fujianensis]|nr:hypothetical protein M3Y99_00534500 [Aphelenchoides fujianensis]
MEEAEKSEKPPPSTISDRISPPSRRYADGESAAELQECYERATREAASLKAELLNATAEASRLREGTKKLEEENHRPP